MKQLSIKGKVISVEKIGQKTLNQFKQQLKQNGLQVSDSQAESVYNALHGGVERNK